MATMSADDEHGRHRQGGAATLVHPALFYADDEAYLAGTVPFLREGLDAGEPVMMAAPPDRLDLVHAALGPQASDVVFHDMTVAGRNPGRIIAGVLRAFVDEHGGRPRADHRRADLGRPQPGGVRRGGAARGADQRRAGGPPRDGALPVRHHRARPGGGGRRGTHAPGHPRAGHQLGEHALRRPRGARAVGQRTARRARRGRRDAGVRRAGRAAGGAPRPSPSMRCAPGSTRTAPPT